jgi:hypothetical protein
LLPGLQPTAKIQVGNLRRRLLKAPVQIDPSPNLLRLRGRDVIGLQFPRGENGELILRVQVLPVGTAAVGLATGASALDERAWEHFPQRAETADETTPQLQLRIAGHKRLLLSDINYNVRRRPCQAPKRFAKMPWSQKRRELVEAQGATPTSTLGFAKSLAQEY